MTNVVRIAVRADDETHGFAGIRAGFEQALGGLKGLAVAAGADLASSLAGPLVAAAGTTVAAFASAGAAVGAFGAAAAPQIGLIKGAVAQYDAANKALESGSKTGAKQMALFNEKLSKLPPATRQTAIAFLGLRDDFKAWSDELAPKTMPVFTKGIGVLRKIIPELTPLVKVGADALSGFMDSIDKGVSGGGMKSFIGKLTSAAKETLPALLNSVKNVVVGLGGLVGAFLPFSGGFAQGLEKLTQGFANWGKSLGQNQGFQQWMADMQQRGPGILELFGNLIKTVLAVAQALAPFSGLTLVVAEALAKLVASIPQGVMDWLAPTIGGIVLAIRAWAVVQGILNIALAANPIGIVVIAIAALVGGLIYAYQHSEKFRDVVNRAWSAVKAAVSGAWSVIQPVLSELASWFTGTAIPAISDFASEAGTSFGKIKDTVTSAFGDAKKVLEEFVGFLDTNVSTAINDLVKGVDGIGSSVKGLPDQLSGLKGLGGGGDKDKDKGAASSALSAVSKPFVKLADTIKKTMSGLFKWIESHWDDALDGVAKAAGAWGKAMETLWSKPFNWIIKFSSSFWGTLTGMVLAGIRKIGHAILSPLPGIQKQWDQHMHSLGTAASHMVSSVIQWVGKLPGRIAGIASRMWSSIPRSLSGVAASVRGILNSLGGWISGKLSSIASAVSNAVSSVAGAIPGFAHGGIVGAAGGGPRSNLVMVGEQGRELVRLPFGSTVIPHGQTELMMEGKGSYGKSGKPAARNPLLAGLLAAVDGTVAEIKRKMADITATIKKRFDGGMEDHLVAWVRRNTTNLEKLADRRDALAKRIADAKKFAKDTASNLVGASGIGNLSDEEGSSPGRIQQTLQQRAGVMASFARVIEALKKKGLNATGLQEIIGKGADAGSALGATILNGGSSGIKALNNAQSQLAKAAGKVGNAAADALFDSGKGAAKGFLTGLKAQKAELQKQMEHLAEHFAKALTKVFKVKPGITRGHAAGGAGGGLAWVGEMGRELVRLPYGSSVIPNGQSEAIAAGSGGSAARMVLELNSAGARMDDLLIEILSHAVRARGGDVQVVLGRG